MVNRNRPRQHTRKLKNGKKVIVNKGRTKSSKRKRSFGVGQKIYFKGKKGFVADKIGNKYALWDSTGEKEMGGVPDDWVDEMDISRDNNT